MLLKTTSIDIFNTIRTKPIVLLRQRYNIIFNQLHFLINSQPTWSDTHRVQLLVIRQTIIDTHCHLGLDNFESIVNAVGIYIHSIRLLSRHVILRKWGVLTNFIVKSLATVQNLKVFCFFFGVWIQIRMSWLLKMSTSSYEPNRTKG